jgi:murein DD-endopeptidase MepM/ murein hydrolase activator NlpD
LSPLLAVGCAIGAATLFSSSSASASGCNTALPSLPTATGSPPQGPSVSVKDLDSEQLSNADVIKKVAQSRKGITAHDTVLALMVAYQESQLRDLHYGDRDSLGLFQQRPSQGWGSPDQILDPVYATNKFFDALVEIQGRDKMSYLDLAIAVQHPSRAAYLSSNNYFPGWQPLAEELMGAGFQPGDCTGGSARGYVSPFVTKARPSRVDQGADYCLNPGDPIRAIGDAQVVNIQQNWYNGQPLVWYKLLGGSLAGKYVYVAEEIILAVKPGQQVRAGTTIATYASSGTCIEAGFADANGATLARSTGGYKEGWTTAAGVSYNKLMTEMGIPTAKINQPVHGSVAGMGLP